MVCKVISRGHSKGYDIIRIYFPVNKLSCTIVKFQSLSIKFKMSRSEPHPTILTLWLQFVVIEKDRTNYSYVGMKEPLTYPHSIQMHYSSALHVSEKDHLQVVTHTAIGGIDCVYNRSKKLTRPYVKEETFWEFLYRLASWKSYNIHFQSSYLSHWIYRRFLSKWKEVNHNGNAACIVCPNVRNTNTRLPSWGLNYNLNIRTPLSCVVFCRGYKCVCGDDALPSVVVWVCCNAEENVTERSPLGGEGEGYLTECNQVQSQSLHFNW
jgi:hypothetical protein